MRRRGVGVGGPCPGLDRLGPAAAVAWPAARASRPAARRRAAGRTARARRRGRPARSAGTRPGCRRVRRSGHRGASSADCRMRGGAGWSVAGYRCGMQRLRRAACSGVMDTDSRLTADLARDLDGALRGARHRPPGPAASRSPCGSSATAAPPRRPPRTPSSAPTGRSRRTTASGSVELRLRPWLATIVLNLCRTRICPARRPGRRTALVRHRDVAAARARRDRRGHDRRPPSWSGGRARALGRPPRLPSHRPTAPPSCSATSTA